MTKENLNKNCTWKSCPDVGMIEITNACNFSCIMCPNKHMIRKRGFISVETFTKALDRYSEAGIDSIKLYTVGESLLHPEFMKLWRIAISYPFKTIMISTNASLLTEKMIKEFTKSSKFKIQISFSGWNDRSYELRYVGGNFKDVVDKIKLLGKLIKKAKLPQNTLTINGVVSGGTGSIPKTRNFLMKEIGLDVKQIYLRHASKWIDVIQKANNCSVNLKNNKKYYCHIANTRIGVLFDGRVTACGCFDIDAELIIENIFDNSILEIRAGKKFQEFISKLDTGNVSNLMCSKCDCLKEIR
jgi:radical SAM protein with 4Fe4S-binding SPASM domain